MNIIHVLTSLNIGGAERFVIDLSVLQIKSNNKVKIISFGKESDPLVEVCNNLNIDVNFISGNLFQRTKMLNNLFAHGDVIHFHSPHALKASLFSSPCLKSKNVIYTRHGAHPFGSGSWKLMHSVFKNIVNSITFVSEDGSQVFHSVHKWSSIQSKTIENGIIMPELKDPKPMGDKIRIGSVGRMAGLKNQVSLLRAFHLLDEEIKEKVELHFYGNGECMDMLQEYKSEHLTNENIIFHGIVKDREIIYNNIDVLVVTSETEGLSLAIIEAMSYRNPTLATNVGGNPRLVINNKTGHLFEYNDDLALVNLITKYVKSKEIIPEQGKLAREYVQDTFSLESTWEKYQEVYKK
jgi:glycosyltransferase involved in cell wall biosynthesis